MMKRPLASVVAVPSESSCSQSASKASTSAPAMGARGFSHVVSLPQMTQRRRRASTAHQ